MNICISCPEGHPVILDAEKLGQLVACPRCFLTFPAELPIGPTSNARKDDRTVRRSRDDDDDEDDDEEEERPKKKPLAKRPVKGRARDEDEDEDDDDDEEDEDDGEEEPEIEWTGRKRQLNTCGIGLMVMMAGFYVLVAIIVSLVLPMIWYMFEVARKISNAENKIFEPTADNWFVLGVWIIAPLGAISLTLLVIGMFFQFFVPARAEGRGLVICSLIFGGLVYLLGGLILSVGGITQDEARQDNMRKLFELLAGICYLVCYMSAMAYLAKLMTFMKLHLEASQPITNTMFYFLYFAGMFVLFVANSYVSYYIFWFACFAMIAALFFAGGMAVRSAIAQALLFLKVRRVIMKYIRDD